MCSPHAVISAFEAFDAAGMRPPPIAGPGNDRPERLARLAKTWASALLADLSDDQVARATLAWCCGASAWWPTPGQLRAALPVDQASVVDWGEGWARLEIVRRSHPGGASPHATTPARFHPHDDVDVAIRAGLEAIGGWHRFGRMTDDEENTTRAHFRGAYVAAMERAKRDREDAAVTALLGDREPAPPKLGTWDTAGNLLPMRRER